MRYVRTFIHITPDSPNAKGTWKVTDDELRTHLGEERFAQFQKSMDDVDHMSVIIPRSETIYVDTVTHAMNLKQITAKTLAKQTGIDVVELNKFLTRGRFISGINIWFKVCECLGINTVNVGFVSPEEAVIP